MTSQSGELRAAGSALPARFFVYLACAGVVDAGYVVAYVAQGWLVEKLTNSPLWLGIVFGTGQLPFLMFSLLGGSLADRYDRGFLVATGNFGILLIAGTMAALVAANAMTIPLVTILFFGIGTIIALEHPVDRSWLYDLVRGRQLGRAIAMSSVEWSVATTIGPAVGGLVVAGIGIAAGYATFALSAIPLALLGLLLGRRSARSSTPAQATTRVRVALHPALVPFCLLIACFTIFVNPYVALLPDFANHVLHADARGYGLLMAVTGAGAIAGGLLLTTLGEVRHRGRIVVVTLLASTVLLAAFAVARSWPLSALAIFGLGITQTLVYTLSNTFVQRLASDSDRGRANAAFSLAFLGGIPVGNLGIGALAARLGTPAALEWSGALAAAACVVFWFGAPQVRDAA